MEVFLDTNVLADIFPRPTLACICHTPKSTPPDFP